LGDKQRREIKREEYVRERNVLRIWKDNLVERIVFERKCRWGILLK